MAVRNRAAAQRHFDIRRRIAAHFAAASAQGSLDEESEAGTERRADLSAEIAKLGNAENESWGIEYGYRYDGSPAQAFDDEKRHRRSVINHCAGCLEVVSLDNKR